MDEAKENQYLRHQRWLLFLCHAHKCSIPEGHCRVPDCSREKQLWKHIGECRDNNCSYERCGAARTLVSHHQHCRDVRCPLCLPVRRVIMEQNALLEDACALDDYQVSETPHSASLPYSTSETDSSMPKIKGVSLIDLFTLEQVEQHIADLREWGQQVSIAASFTAVSACNFMI
eukprot:Gb_41618 [translate_table: standard]